MDAILIARTRSSAKYWRYLTKREPAVGKNRQNPKEQLYIYIDIYIYTFTLCASLTLGWPKPGKVYVCTYVYIVWIVVAFKCISNAVSEIHSWLVVYAIFVSFGYVKHVLMLTHIQTFPRVTCIWWSMKWWFNIWYGRFSYCDDIVAMLRSKYKSLKTNTHTYS